MGEPRPDDRLIWILLAACVTLVGTLLTQSSLNVVLPVMEREWGVSHGTSGTLFAVYQAGYILASAAFLLSMDRLRARGAAGYPLWLPALVAAAAGTAFPLLAGGVVSAGVLRFLAGVGLGGVYMPGLNLLARQIPPERRGRYVGLYVASFILAQGVSLAATGSLVSRLGWRESYLVMGLASWVAPAAGLLVVRLLPAREEVRPDAAAAPRPARRSGWLPASGVFAASLVYAGHNWELYGVRSWLTPYLAQAFEGSQGLTAAITQAAWLNAGTVLLGALSTGVGGAVSDRLGRIRTAAVLLVASSVTTALLGWSGHWPLSLLVTLLVLSGLSLNADSPIYSTMVTEMADPARLGRAQAWQTVLGFGAAGISPWVLGLVADRWGWGVAFGGGAAGAWAGLVVLARLALAGAPTAVHPTASRR
ncbi:MFS transporter [Limnochorda pilosa]|uniref:MFS transporter n=1 Tax=Limnochorda pilosa TaxID=1555112 RepID=A0A0K2SH50_LIMPI|nr:MFS transporter [Limnochorda pilosa]